MAVGGIGGSVNAAGFYLDSLLLPTMEAANPLDPNDPMNLLFSGAPVLVSDITVRDPLTNQTLTLDGLLGMNYMVASSHSSGLTLEAILANSGICSTGVFNWIVFDEAAGTLGLDLNQNAVPEPGTWALLAIAATTIVFRSWVRRNRQAA
jgi:hypothetical protein